MTHFSGMTHAIFKLLLWQKLMQFTILPEGVLSFILWGDILMGVGFVID